MKAIVVFCGSKKGNLPIFEEVAAKTGQILAQKNITLVYGGGGVGLMGITANAALAHRGRVIGVIPDFLIHLEGTDAPLTEQYIVSTMHERKQKMAQLSDGVLVLPGAYGTLDELFEMLTLAQLNQGSWPIGILNTNGYYDHLIAHFDLMVNTGFLSPKNRALIIVEHTVDRLIDALIQKPSSDMSTAAERM